MIGLGFALAMAIWIIAGVYLIIHGHLWIGVGCLIAASTVQVTYHEKDKKDE